MIIDSHQHVFWHRRNDDDLVRDMDEHGIDQAWLLSWELPAGQESPRRYVPVLNPLHRREDGTHRGIPLEDLILARDRHPGRFIVGYCPDPAVGDPAALFEAAYHMHRVRVCGEWKFRMLIDDPRCLQLFHKAGELGCPVVLHLDVPYLKDPQGGPVIYQEEWYGGTVHNLMRALETCPQTNFIGHAPGFWRHISGDADEDPSAYPSGPLQPDGLVPRMLRRFGNLYADLSAGSGLRALQRDPQHARQFLQEFSDRLLFGRDYYGGELLAFLRGLQLPPQTLEGILCNNASRLVNVPVDDRSNPPLMRLGLSAV